jgi:hypothetical protein
VEHRITWGGDPEDAGITTWGTATAEGLDVWVQEALSDSRFHAKMRLLVDHRQLDWSGLSSDDVHERVKLFANDAAHLDSARLAVVMGTQVDFGMARMEQAYIDIDPDLKMKTRVFFTIEDAREWLSEQPALDASSIGS